MKKENIIFLVFLAGLLLFVVFFGSSKSENLTGNFVAYSEPDDHSNEVELSNEERAFLGMDAVYIVQFTEPAVYSYSIQSADSVSRIDFQHQQALEDIREIIYGQDYYSAQSDEMSDDFVIAEYKYVLNGMALNLSPYEKIIVQSLPYVKSVELSKTYYIDLNESIPLINADDVWNLTDGNGDNVTGKNVTIAVLDTGVDYNHADLGSCTNETFLARTCSKVIGGWDYTNNDSDPMDDNGHGTHVAATAAGNGTLKGVAPGANIAAYKVCSYDGSCNTYHIMLAVENASYNNYSIISLSLGGGGSPDDSQSIAIDNAVNNGIIAVIAAGNSGPSSGSIESPGTSRKAITVGASTKTDSIASFSSRGPTDIGTVKPDILAPGYLICAAKAAIWYVPRMGTPQLCIDSTHAKISGTSMATPHVAGVAALILQKHPDWAPIDVKMAIRNMAKDLGYQVTVQGHGRIDAFAAVNLTNKPCTAEFNTYNTTWNIQDIYSFKGTASCDNFNNYSLLVSYPLTVPNGTLNQFYSGGSADSVQLSFTENEVKNFSIVLPKVVNVTNMRFKIKGADGPGTFPYLPMMDVGADGDYEWFGYNQTGQFFDDAFSRITAMWYAQAFNWSGGNVSGISFLMSKGGYGQDLVVDIRNANLSSGTPLEVIYSFNISNSAVSSKKWYFFNFSEIELPVGIYFLVLRKNVSTASGTNYDMYRYSKNIYNGGFNNVDIVYSINNGSTWTLGVGLGDFAFKIIRNNYFDGEEITGNFNEELNSAISNCIPDMSLNCTLYFTVNSTNGTLNVSALSVNYTGGFSEFGAWETLNSSSSPVVNSTLFNVNTNLLGYDQRLFMLKVEGNNSISKDYLIKFLNNYEISPESGTMIKNGVEFTGVSAAGDLIFENYTLDYKLINETNWHEIIFLSGVSVNNGTLGYFNSTSLDSGEYVVRFTAYVSGVPVPIIMNLTLLVDKTLKDGWPQELDFSGFSSPKFADLDGDGMDEIIVRTGYSQTVMNSFPDNLYREFNRSVYVFESNGSIANGWPKPVNFWRFDSPALADLDNDSLPEVIMASFDMKQLQAWNYDGTAVPGWPISFASQYVVSTPPSVSDLDGDGKLEVIFGIDKFPNLPENGSLVAYSANGTRIWEFPLRFSITEMLSIGDVNGDGLKEILFHGTSQSPVFVRRLFLLNSTGSVMEGWPINSTMNLNETLFYTLADLNKDNKMEILYSRRTERNSSSPYAILNMGGIFAVYPNMTPVEGWPYLSSNYFWFLSTADLNSDKSLEVFAAFGAGVSNSSIIVLNSTGSVMPGYPFMYELVNINRTMVSSPITVGDIDGDGKKEILFGAIMSIYKNGVSDNMDHGRFYSLDYELPGITEGYPKVPATNNLNSNAQSASPAITDIDKDGKSEMIAAIGHFTRTMPNNAYAAGRLIVWETQADYNSSFNDWDQRGNNIWNTNAYEDLDFDGIGLFDNCPFTPNFNQTNLDNDRYGDACDSIIGYASSLNTTLNISIEVGNTTNLLEQFNVTKEVRFYLDSALLFNFSQNFSNFSLNLINVTIEQNITGNDTYVIISNLNISGEKTIYLQRTNNLSNSVCFVDSDNVSLSELKSNCTKLNCPGTFGNYSCMLSNNTFIVSGFRHSAVMEITSVPPLLTIYEPANNSEFIVNDSFAEISFNFSFIDDDLTQNCSIYLDGTINKTNDSAQNNTVTNFIANVSAGSHSWQVNCSDGVHSSLSELRNFSIIYCGDEIANGLESCDSYDLKGKTCTSLGYDTGTLSCTVSCTFTGCSNNAGGGSGGGSGGGGGGGLVTVPSEIVPTEEVLEPQLPSEEIATTDKPAETTEEAKLPITEQPAQLPEKEEKKISLLAIFIFLGAIIILIMLVYFKRRKKKEPIEKQANFHREV